MALLQNEDFAIYQLRTSYLAKIHDGIGERLINIDPACLNDPAFRAAAWFPDAAEIKRTYSPPIPTTGTSEYFQAPLREPGGFGEDDGDGARITGVTSNDALALSTAGKRRRRKEQLEEDDSSDLSDESNDETEIASRPVNQIRFAKMPVRARADSSPIRSSAGHEGPSVLVTSPSRPPDSQRLRRGSLGVVESVKARARRDTATSSEVSSEGDLDPSVFKRKQVTVNLPSKPSRTLRDQIKEEDQDTPSADDGLATQEETTQDEEGSEIDSDDSSLASGFSATVGTSSLMEEYGPLTSSPLVQMKEDVPRDTSPRKLRSDSNTIQALPPPRPISTIQPSSALGAAIRAKNKKPMSPFDRFAPLSGRGNPNPLYIKIYSPSSASSGPLEILLRRESNQGVPVTVADAIGFSLWRYAEEELKPALSSLQRNVNRWTLRIVDDGEPDFDFPALTRTKAMSDFASNNNRGGRGRSKQAWDEFALVVATETQFEENEELTPDFGRDASMSADLDEASSKSQVLRNQRPMPELPSAPRTRHNPITDHRYALAAMRKDSTNAMDVPATETSHATPRTGAYRTLNIHFTDNDLMPHVMPIETTSDTYIAEVFDQICQKLNVDKGLYVLRVSHTTTVAPSDRTVEALGPKRSSLDLARRRFVGDGNFGLSGSPGSTSPNAPLLLTTTGTPTKKAKGRTGIHPLAQRSDVIGIDSSGIASNYKRYNVIRKQPMSFAPSHPRVIAIDGEYMHVMPSETGKEKAYDAIQGKTTTIHFSSVVGCKVSRKHPKSLRVDVFKERETKRYDFEASSASEAADIIRQIKKGVEPFRDRTAL